MSSCPTESTRPKPFQPEPWPPIRYDDFARWREEYWGESEGEQTLAFWSQMLIVHPGQGKHLTLMPPRRG